MRKKIKDFNPTDKAVLILRLSDIQIRKTTANADYASMLGFDGTDLIEVKIWALTDEKREILKNGEVYELSGIMKDYQGKMQFNVSELRMLDDSEIDKSEFFEYAKMNEEELKEAIINYINLIDNPVIKKIVFTTLKQFFSEFFKHPAAMSMHHNYFGGLAYHVYSMLTLSDTYLQMYPYFNRSLVYGGIILHDIGKMIELSGPKGTEYTKEGNLLGHIAIGSNIVYKVASDLGVEKTDEFLSLQHIILSHHGLLEYGSPKEPQIPEAVLIHILDLSDSRLAALEKEALSTLPGDFTEPIPAFERKKFYKPDI
ncbi:MAG TPA: HD domain-containing protein [Acholeplasmataceae bacterium]|jgi:3'-5' exoribonuclease|nr:HD domain-containing protein [Acholeplasmataceae bacterium]